MFVRARMRACMVMLLVQLVPASSRARTSAVHGLPAAGVTEQASARSDHHSAASCCAPTPPLSCRAICSVEQEVLPGGRRVVLLATPSALHVAVGGPALTGLFAQ